MEFQEIKFKSKVDNFKVKGDTAIITLKSESKDINYDKLAEIAKLDTQVTIEGAGADLIDQSGTTSSNDVGLFDQE